MELKKNSRKIAVQAVFQFFFSNEEANKVLDEFHEYRVKEKAYCRLKYDINFFKDDVCRDQCFIKLKHLKFSECR